MRWRYEALHHGETSSSKVLYEDEILGIFVDSENLFTGAKDLREQLGELSTLEQDLLMLAAAIFAADRASKRGEREKYNRNVALEVSLYNVDRFYPLVRDIVRILRLLTQDAWSIDLRQAHANPSWGNAKEASCKTGVQKGSALLFSGGLDSLAAAVEYGSKAPLFLVSHVTRNQITDRAQEKLATLLKKKKLVADHAQIFVSSKGGGQHGIVHDAEPSQRTRSLVFLVLGCIAARRRGYRKIIYMAENGQMAIHLPLSGGRIGAFSTHTAHPSVLAHAQELLSTVLGVPIQIVNPYLYLTKAEVVARVVQGLPNGLAISTSCWRNARVSSAAGTHCGECVPCIIRRIAVERNGKDPTKYRRDLFRENFATLDEEDDGRRNLADIADFVARFSTNSDAELQDEFTDLISDDFDASKVIKMYRRFSEDARVIFSKYPKLLPLIT